MRNDRITPRAARTLSNMGPPPLRGEFPDSREISRESLKISPDSGLLGRFWEPVAERIQPLVANSLLLRKQRIFVAGSGNDSPEQGIVPNGSNVGSSFPFRFAKVTAAARACARHFGLVWPRLQPGQTGRGCLAARTGGLVTAWRWGPLNRLICIIIVLFRQGQMQY